jgi:hypothetical protein
MMPEREPSPDNLPPTAQRPPGVSGQGDAVTIPPISGTDTEATVHWTPPADPASPENLPAQFGRYLVQRLLGAGGMGAVYLAHDTQLDRPVALKIPRFGVSEGSSTRERFLREARAAACVHHANICPVHDVGEIAGRPYLTMSFIEGRSLAEALKSQSTPVRPRTIAVLIRKLALALEEAHRHQVVHRDLKPANVMLTKRGEPIIMDFGLARRQGTDDARLTHDGAIMGTPAYMAPEQARGNPDEVGPACDIYSLGVIFYELLAGRVPFKGNAIAILAQLTTEEPAAPSSLKPDVDPALELICRKAMAKAVADRYCSMGELAVALADYLKQAPPGAEALLPQAPDTMLRLVPETAPPRAASTRRSVQGRKRRAGERKLEMMAAVLIAVVLGAGAAIGGLVYYFSTNEGTVPIVLSDPRAKVQVKIDGEAVEMTVPEPSVKLAPGKHLLEVTGKGYKPSNPEFAVIRGQNPPLRIVLEPDGTAVAKAEPVKKSPPQPEPNVKEADPKPPPHVPEPSVTTFTWQPDALRAGRVLAPNLTATTPWLRETFANPKSGFPEKNTPEIEKGYRNGKYVVKLKTTTADSLNIAPARLNPPANGDFALELIAHSTGVLARWGCVISQPGGNGPPPIAVLILGSGQLYAGPDPTGAKAKKLETASVRHAAIYETGKKVGPVRNALSVIVKGRYLEAYANGVAVIDPVLLDRPFTTPRFALAAATGAQKGANIEFESLIIGSSGTVLSLEARGATPHQVAPPSKE